MHGHIRRRTAEDCGVDIDGNARWFSGDGLHRH